VKRISRFIDSSFRRTPESSIINDFLVPGLRRDGAWIPSFGGMTKKRQCSFRLRSLHNYVKQPFPSFRRRDCVVIFSCHCERTIVRVASYILSKTYEFASLIIFTRKDITTQPRKPESSDY